MRPLRQVCQCCRLLHWKPVASPHRGLQQTSRACCCPGPRRHALASSGLYSTVSTGSGICWGPRGRQRQRTLCHTPGVRRLGCCTGGRHSAQLGRHSANAARLQCLPALAAVSRPAGHRRLCCQLAQVPALLEAQSGAHCLVACLPAQGQACSCTPCLHALQVHLSSHNQVCAVAAAAAAGASHLCGGQA